MPNTFSLSRLQRRLHVSLSLSLFTASLFGDLAAATGRLSKGYFGKMADSTPEKRKPVFTKVDQLRPATSGHTLTVKVVDSKIVKGGGQPRSMKIAECLVGDETGMVVFTARNDQVDLMKPDTTVILRNAKIDMFKGSMRLSVDKWGRIEVTDAADFTVKQDNNLSLVEYELVNVVVE